MNEEKRGVAQINGRELIVYRFDGLWRAMVDGEHVAPRFAFEERTAAMAACESATRR